MAKQIKVRAIDTKRAIAQIALERGWIPYDMVGKSGALLMKARYYMIGAMQLPTDATDHTLLVSLIAYITGTYREGDDEAVAMYLRLVHEGRPFVNADMELIHALLPSHKTEPHPEDEPEDEVCDGDAIEPETPPSLSTREIMVSELGDLPTLEQMRPMIQSQIDALGLTGEITVEEFADIWS